MFNFKRVKQSFAVVTLAALLSTFSATLAPAVSEAAPPPRGSIRVVRHQPRPPMMHRPPVHRPGPVYHRPAPRPHWRPAPPPPRPHHDYHRHDRRVARGIAAAILIAAALSQ